MVQNIIKIIIKIVMYVKKGFRNSYSIENPHNIFSVKNLNQENLIDSKQKLNLTMYSIVGDHEFKKNYIRSTQKLPQLTINLNTQLFNSTTQHKFTRKPYHLQKNNTPIERFQFYSNGWNSLNKTMEKVYLKAPLLKQSIPEVYVHPNPQKIELINENVQQYWMHSLRNNNKRLKDYLKGTSLKPQKVNQMLLTKHGQKCLVESIPKMKQSLVEGRCRKKQIKKEKKEKLSLKGRNSEPNILPYSKKTSQYDFQQVYKINYKWKINAN